MAQFHTSSTTVCTFTRRGKCNLAGIFFFKYGGYLDSTMLASATLGGFLSPPGSLVPICQYGDIVQFGLNGYDPRRLRSWKLRHQPECYVDANTGRLKEISGVFLVIELITSFQGGKLN